MKAIVFFYDGKDITTGTFISMEEALKEDYIQVKGNEFAPFDECAIIFWYDEDYPDGGYKIYPPESQAMLEDMEFYHSQHIGDYRKYMQIAATAEF